MASVIEMPKLSDTMEEGGIANWLKKEGDFVEEGEVLVEIETDKATMEYQSPEEGFLTKILAPAGTSADLDTPIAILTEKHEEVVDIDTLLKKTSQRFKKNQKQSDSSLSEKDLPATILQKDSSYRKRKISPFAKKIATEKGLDLDQIEGTGPAGRVVARDVENQSYQSETARVVIAGEQNEVIALSMMRKTIAKRLLAAKKQAPHFYLSTSASMTTMLNWRKDFNEELVKKNLSQKISINDLIILAVSKALTSHLEINSSWKEDQIILHHHIHVAFALALSTGLVTPVLRHADRLGLREIATTVKSLASQAKQGKLGNNDYEGGTFTVSNLGMYGIENFTAIINPPQAAILAVGATRKMPSVDKLGNLIVEERMSMTMSCDHRLIDGAIAAKFLRTLVKYLEKPLSMLEN